MTSETPEPQDPSPQDAARFSRAKTEPPILDLKAEKSEPEKATPKAEPPKHDTVRIEKQPSRTWPIGGFLGGLIGGGLVALGVLAYAQLTDKTSIQITTLESALIEKVDRNVVAAIETRLTDMDAALAETKAMIGTIGEKYATPDADLMKRIATLETAIRSLDTKAPLSVLDAGEHRNALRLALVLSLRDSIRNGLPGSREIAALATSGESSQAFVALQHNLISPLISFDEVRAEIVALTKDAAIEQTSQAEQNNSSSRLSSFFSQLVTVRPASPITKPVPGEASFSSLLDAVDQDDAKMTLSALSALPQSEQQKFKSIENELKRRVTVESAIVQLLDDALDAIAKGDTP